jgi:hypothetical protein
VDASDSGVYICMVLEDSGTQSIISVASLAVKPTTPTIKTRATQRIHVDCKSELLSYVYKDLNQRWEVNGKLWKDYGYATLAAVSEVLFKVVLVILSLRFLSDSRSLNCCLVMRTGKSLG